AGAYTLTRAARANTQAVTATDTGASIRIVNSQIGVEFSKQGDALMRGFKLGGSEMLRAPASVQMALPRRALINKLIGSDAAIVTDRTWLKVSDEGRFENFGSLRWDAPAGSARLVTAGISEGVNHTYRIDEGTPRQEDVTVSSATPGDLHTATNLKFAHGAG